MNCLQFKPVDTWFFRGGTPFTMGSAPQENVLSHFPPSPSTITGALRSALARARGWEGRGSWPKEMCEVLGDGPENLGCLRFQGPFLLLDGQPVFPVPRHILGESTNRGWVPVAALQPGDIVLSDLGDVRLPAAEKATRESKPCSAKDYWLTVKGMQHALNGNVPAAEDVLPSNKLWSDELRIGLERDRSARTAKEGMLYSARHVRLRDNVSLGVRIFGLPAEWPLPLDTLVPLGGENRLAECKQWRGDFSLGTPMNGPGESGKILLTAITPVDLNSDARFEGGTCELLEGLRVVSACLDRATRIGGWDYRKGGSPLPMRSMIAPGSAFFCEADDNSAHGRVGRSDKLIGVGLRTEVGYGLTAVGCWC